MYQCFTMLYFVNNTDKVLNSINVRVEGFKKENVCKRLKKGAVETTFLSTTLIDDHRDAFIYYNDNSGNKHEQKILDKFYMKNVTKFKIRISGIDETGELIFTLEEERY